MFTLFDRYLISRFVTQFILVLLILWGIIYLFEVIELLRRSSNHQIGDLIILLEMAGYKLPQVAQRILPFAVLISALLMFWQMARQQEWIVLRALGWPAWRFLLPLVLIVFTMGLVRVGAIQPLGSMLYSQYEKWDQLSLRYQNTSLILLKTGLWLREPLQGGGSRIVHVQRLGNADQPWEKINIWEYGASGGLTQRFDSPTVILDAGKAWRLPNALRSLPDGSSTTMYGLNVPTTLSIDQLAERFASPETMNIWRMPTLIHILQQNGLTTAKLEFMQASLWAEPLLYIGLILLAGAFGMRYSRSGREVWLLGIGLMIGFGLFLLRDILQALAVNNILPIILAAWIPGLLALLGGATLLLFYEDG